MKLLSAALLATILLTAFSCKDKNSMMETPDPIDYSCVQLFDANGQSWGIYGDCNSDNHWGAITLSVAEKALLNFTDTTPATATTSPVIDLLAIYPLPVIAGNATFFSLRSSTPDIPVKIKLTIVNEQGEVKMERALSTQTNGTFALLFDSTIFQAGTYYRIYYTAEAGTNTVFEGYGNILVCNTYVAPGNGTIE